MTTGSDPKRIIDESPMSRLQLMAIVICVLLNALDGFDVLAISFASPGIAAEWSINRAELGVVLAMELVGMALGSVLLGGLADRIGRRPTILICLVVMTMGMAAAAFVHSVEEMLVVRVVTGLGIGGMLASTNAMVAEFSNAKYRNLAVIVMATGYPMGAILGGSVSAVLLQEHSWRIIFEFGAICTGSFLLIVWFLLPESIEYLSNKRPLGALDRINDTLRKMGHGLVAHLPENVAVAKKASYAVLFSPRFRALTLLLILGYFTHIMTFYFTLKWIPKIVVDMGYSPSAAGSVLVWANVGGALGGLLLGVIAGPRRLKPLLIGVLVMAFLMVSFFGRGFETIATLSVVAAIAGFFTNAGVVGFYAVMASSFPSEIRASGTGVVIGMGRGGAALGPVIAGFLFTAGFSLQLVAIAMGVGAVIAAIAIYFVRPAPKGVS